jgi:hypothetical protein
MENLWKIYEPTPPTDQLNGRCNGRLHLASAGDERHLSHDSGKSIILWPFQVPKLKVPTIYKAYVRPM